MQNTYKRLTQRWALGIGALLLSGLAMVPPTYAAEKIQDTTVIGSDKRTGGEAPTDRPRMEAIQEGAQRLKDRIEKERQERQQQQK